MTTAQSPSDETVRVDSSPSEDEAQCAAESATEPATEGKQPLPKSGQQPRYPNPRGLYRGQKVGMGPRGSRRSMGKR